MKKLVIMPGGYHPFHAGHMALYNSARRAFPDADVYVAATNDTSERPFPFAIKEKLAKLAGVEAGHFVQVKSPFQAREITQNYDPETTALIFVRSEKDRTKPPQAGGTKKDGTSAYLQPITAELNPMNKNGYMAYLPTVEFGPGMTSATEIRTAWPKLNDKRKTALVMSLYPKTQSNPKLAQTVIKMLDTAIGSEQGMTESKSLTKKVKIVKGPDAGKTGWIREIKHGAFKGAPKTYYVDLDDGGQANNLPGTALRLVKDNGVTEGAGNIEISDDKSMVIVSVDGKDRFMLRPAEGHKLKSYGGRAYKYWTIYDTERKKDRINPAIGMMSKNQAIAYVKKLVRLENKRQQGLAEGSLADAAKHVKKGALHKQEHIPLDKKIGATKLKSLKAHGTPLERKRANFALNIQGIKEDAVADLERDMKPHSNYTAIDRLMTKLAAEHNITPEELHDKFVNKHHMIPDEWIKHKPMSENDFDDSYDSGVRFDYDEHTARMARLKQKALASQKLKAQGKKPEARLDPKTGKYYVDFTAGPDYLDEESPSESPLVIAALDTVDRLFRKRPGLDYKSLEAIKQGLRHHLTKEGATVDTAVQAILDILNRRKGGTVDTVRFKEALRQSLTHNLNKHLKNNP